MFGLKLGLGFNPASGASGGGGGGDSEAALNAILETYTLRLDPIEANITKDENDLISAFAETGTVEGTYVQATEGNKPLWEADGGNGKPCVTLQDTNDSLARSENASYNTYYSTGEAFLVVVMQTATLDFTRSIFTSAVVWGVTGRLFIQRASAIFRGNHYDGSTDFGNSGTISADTRYIIALRHLDGKVGLSVNGGAWTELESGDTDTPDTAAAWIIGNVSTGGNPGKYFQYAGRPTYPGDEDYAALVALLAEVYDVTI